MATDGKKTYKEVINRINDRDDVDLVEGSGVITNTLASSLLKKVRALEQRIASTKKLEDKIDYLAQQNTKLAGLDVIAIAVSGESKGIFDKGARLLSIVRAVMK